jgi:hypothetical protein
LMAARMARSRSSSTTTFSILHAARMSAMMSSTRSLRGLSVVR